MSSKRRGAKQARKLRNIRKKEREVSNVEASLDLVRKQYANNWSTGHASHFRSQGDYDWMAQFLRGCDCVVEIGTGDACGTVALCRGGAVVISIEKNPYCLQLAEQHLREEGIPVTVEQRGDVVVQSTDSYEIAYGQVKAEVPDEGVLLLGGDVTVDSQLAQWFRARAPFDGIACWNIGTHRLKSDVTSDPSQYRLIVQNGVYEMAECILRPGGILHVVDRGRAPTQDCLEEMVLSQLEGHQDQASVTDLQVDPNIAYRVYEPPVDGTGISMQAAETSTFEFDGRNMAFWSIVSHKPE